MANNNISFGGQQLSTPGVYYADNVSAGLNSGNQFNLPLIYIGYSYNGASGKAYNFSNAQNLLAFIRGGPASGYVEALTNPSPSLAGANNITFIPVGANTPATLTLNNAAGSAALYLTTATSGIPSNLTQADVTVGSLYTTFTSNLTLYDGYAGTTFIGYNLGVPFQIAYTGTATGSGVSFQVSGASGVATNLLVNSPNAGESFNISLTSGQYSTVSSVVQYLNGTGFWTASLISSTGGALPSSSLTISGATTLTGPGTGAFNFLPVVSIPGDAAYWVNQPAVTIATATAATGASGNSPLANISLTHFSGATSTPPTTSSYASGFNLALSQAGWVVFADSNSSAVQQLGAQHVETASSTLYGAWRRFFTGSSVGDSVTTTLANAAAMNCLEACYFYPGLQIVSTTTGNTITYGGIMAAAMAAGIACANQVALPLTNKALNAAGVELSLTTSQINQLQQGGVCPIWLAGTNNSVPTIVSDQTTWQVDSNPLNVFTQQVACRWWLAYSMVNALEPFVGGIAAPTTLTSLANAAKAVLNASIYTPGSNGVLASWATGSLVVSYNGQTQQASITASATTVGQYRFITETVNIQLYSGTVSGG